MAEVRCDDNYVLVEADQVKEWLYRSLLPKFRPRDVPTPGSPLLGLRLVVCVEDRYGFLVPWSEWCSVGS